MNDREAVEKIIGIASRAGEIARDCRKHGLNVQTKSHAYDFFTDADEKCQAFIVDSLQKLFPEDSIVGEEDCDIKKDPARIWLIDPIDGTKGYKDGKDDYCVMIGLLVNKRPHIGVVHAPDLEKTYHAIRGKGSFVRREGVDKKLHVNQNNNIEGANFITKYCSDKNDTAKEDIIMDLFPNNRRIGVNAFGIKACMIAEGLADFHVHTSKGGGKWDTCAPTVILEEAGGTITGYGGTPIEYEDLTGGLKDGIVCSNTHLHSQVIKRLKDGGWGMGPKLRK